MKIILISILYISIPCFAGNSWPQDHEKSVPSLLDPSRPYVDPKVEENKYLENISEQVKEQEKETQVPEVQAPDKSSPQTEEANAPETIENTERNPASLEEEAETPTTAE